MPAQIAITLTDDGQLNVSGAISNKILAMGMLEVAKATILAHRPEEQLIQPATLVPPSNVAPNPFQRT